MPIIDQQRRMVEVGRIRMGEKRVAKSGKSYPAKLDTWRLTSPDKTRLTAAASIYGGTVTDWDGQHQLTTESNVLDVAVIPGQALSQYMELWGQRHPKNHDGPNPVLCLRRCDGQSELLSDEPCICKVSGDEQCKPTTRLSVVLRKVPGVGMWRLDTRGAIAAGELVGGVELLEMLTARNRPVRARLRLDQRSTLDRLSGETHNFVVPVLDIDATLDEALDAMSSGRQLPTFTPVARLPEAPTLTVGEQIAQVGQEPRVQRTNAAEPIPATGLRPRTAAGTVYDQPIRELVAECERRGLEASGSKAALLQRLTDSDASAEPPEGVDEIALAAAECSLCGSTRAQRVLDAHGAARCKDTKGCMERVEQKAAVEADPDMAPFT